LPGFEAHGGSCCNIQTKAACSGPVELQCIVRFEEVIMRADLNRPIAAIRDSHFDCIPADIEFDVAGFYE
jgi:hypothetical protein